VAPPPPPRQPAFRHGALDGVAAQAVAAAEDLRATWDAAGPETR
jgi:hypothetical protein